MTPEDALIAMDRIEELRDAIAEGLHRTLIEDPDGFWDAFFETLNSFRNDPTRELAERLIRSGAVHGLTRIGDIPAILVDDAERSKQ
jgi:hypothetical protein